MSPRGRSRARFLFIPALFLAGAALFLSGVPASSVLTTPESELGSPQQQASVRTGRDVSSLPLRTACSVDPSRELFITDLSVVNDCNRTGWSNLCQRQRVANQGAWTVGALLQGVFGTTDPDLLSKLTLKWLGEWKTAKTVNGDTVPARTSVQSLVIDPWLAASGGTTLDLKKAPFRLLAIVARLDLRQNAGYSGGTSAGEARFVFDLLDANGNTTNFLVIFEYGLDASSCTAVKSWAQQFHDLGTIPFGPAYNQALQAITDQFATLGASPQKPNGSAINQVRTNDFFLAQPWELREFKLKGATVAETSRTSNAPLLLSTVAQTPANSQQHNQPVADFANANTAAILADNYEVPLSFGGNPFRGAASRHTLEFGWDGPPPTCTSIADADARHILSLNTCNGCHGGETDVVFKQVEPRFANQEASLSSFLTGGSTTDLCGIPRQFNDIERRRVDLCQLLDKSCNQINAEPVVSFVH